ncbi:uncharacterized protein BCR38DRAFT_446151 [Pseudomassariella vexata]|uniref:Uncharacterized protein n=1 Tax=Pseudomassariella vexata TaxID=1141098 RepID=A0A1Y2DJE4_9PEZI|nr:uncharacterized protein BCR38DRAFT_446151 [Pseudomassariella vexata]ORY59286.1 hypothetical protein BCR38DRAFT_446151 [Pseudomassariella vexata]
MLLKEFHSTIRDPEKAFQIIDEVSELLKGVVVERRRALGEDSLDTLFAYRELITARTMRNMFQISQGSTKQIDWAKLEQRSKEISLSFESRLGSHHPQTLTCRLWWFAFAVLSEPEGSENVIKESKKIMQELLATQITKERLDESSRMRNILTSLLEQAGHGPLPMEMPEDLSRKVKGKGKMIGISP